MKSKKTFERALLELMGAELVRTTGHGELTEFYLEGRTIPGEIPFYNYKYMLLVNCGWRIKEQGRIVVGNRDTLKKVDENEDLHGPRNSKADVILTELISSKNEPLLVEGVRADDLGNTRIYFTQGVILELFPDQNTGERDDYHWILLNDDDDSELVRVKPTDNIPPQPFRKYEITN